MNKSREACIAAVETFNRVSSRYREETFAILMINAWELLLKARIMKENGGQVNCLHLYEYKVKLDGTKSKVKYRKRNKTGAFITIGIDKSMKIVSSYANNSIDNLCCNNIDTLLLIRDSSTHFVSTDALLKKALTEVSLAAVKNYVVAAQKWFQVSFSDLNIATIPISFDLDQKEVEAVAKKRSEAVAKFLEHVKNSSTETYAETSPFSYIINVQFNIVKKAMDDAVKVNIVKEKADLALSVDQDSVPNGFSWEYDNLTATLKHRYSDFSANAKYHAIRKPLEDNPKFCFKRYLNPQKKSGLLKKWYNPNILTEFDKHYNKIEL